MDRNRTAPRDWGAWPPTQERVNTVVEQAARKLAQIILDEPWAQTATILMAQPRSALELDCCFVGTEKEILVGYVRAIAKHKGWSVYWAPATNGGRLSQNHGYDWRA